MQQKLQEGAPAHEIKVEMPATIMKNLSAKGMMATWDELKCRPDLPINGFQKAGFLAAINSVID